MACAIPTRCSMPLENLRSCCPRFDHCDEVAMVRGELPKFAMLPQPANWLVKIEV